MNRQLKTLLFFFVIVTSSATAGGAEIVVPRRVECRSNLVRLLDVVEVRDESARASLVDIELFTAPAAGQERVVRRRELQEMLTLYGFNPTHFQFTGADRVVVTRPAGLVRQTSQVAAPAIRDSVADTIHARPIGSIYEHAKLELPVAQDASADSFAQPSNAATQQGVFSPTGSHGRRARERVERSIVSFLKRSVDPMVDWKVSTVIPVRYLRDLSGRLTEFHVSGGRAPFRGEQQFLIETRVNNRPLQVAVQATISSPDMVVVAAANLRRGEKLSAADLKLAPPSIGNRNRKYFHSIEEVANLETLRAVSEGQPLEAAYVRRPLLVRRFEDVTVYSRSGGVSVHTTGRALDDGALGDVVTVDTSYRKKLEARVVGFQELEVYARGATVRSASSQSR